VCRDVSGVQACALPIYGDPIERDPLEIARDVENGYVTADVAQQVHAVVLDYDEEKNICKVDVEATEKSREEVRASRLNKAIPVEQWIETERKRVLKKDFVTEVSNMYKDTMGISDRFAKEFKEFWNLPEDFTM